MVYLLIFIEEASTYNASFNQGKLTKSYGRIQMSAEYYKLSKSTPLSLATTYYWQIALCYGTSQNLSMIYSPIFNFTTESFNCYYYHCEHGVCDAASRSCICSSGYKGSHCDKVKGLNAATTSGIIVAIVLVKKRGLSQFKFDVYKKPDFGTFAYATDIWSGRGQSAFPSDENSRGELLALLQDPQVCAALCKATSSTEADKFTGAMVYVNATNGHCLDLLMELVDQEVESVPNTTQLFRGNSLATKAFRAYSRMVGLNYLWMTLSRFMHELNHLSNAKEGKKDDDGQQHADGNEGVSILSTEFEVDPSKLAAGADEESQSYMLSQRARQLVLCIINSTQYLPPELRSFAVKLTARITQRFPEADHIAIGGTFFLRFICPAIIAPHSYGLLMTKDRKKPIVPGDRLQRQLILLGKVLQNLANGVLFGKKEPFMIGMNDFISSNLEQVNDWMEQISKGGDSFSEQPGSVPQKIISDSYNFLASHIQNNMNKIRSALQEQNAPADLAQRLEHAVGK